MTEAVAKFAAQNAVRAAAVQRPLIRKQTDVWPKPLCYFIGRELGVRYQPIRQIITLEGQVVTEEMQVLK